MVENERAWKELLFFIDGRQREFNDQLEGVPSHELTPRLVAEITRYVQWVFEVAYCVHD